MSDMFEYARIDPVYYRLGKFEHDAGRTRYIKAPFDILHMPASPTGTIETYVVTKGAPESVSGLYADDRNLEVWTAREGLGYNTLELIVMEEHEMGSWAANGESWKGVHCFAIL